MSTNTLFTSPFTNKLAEVIRTAVLSASEGITVADMRHPQQPLIFANPAFYEITGYSADEVMGRNCSFLQGKDTNPTAVQQIRDALANQQTCLVELLNYRKDGSAFWNRLSLVPIFDQAGELEYYAGLQTDITAEKEMATARERLHAMRATVETVNDIVFNFMNMLNFFRLHMEEELHADAEILEQYDELYNRTLGDLRKLNRLDEYRESQYAGVALVDIEKFGSDGHSERDRESPQPSPKEG